MKNVILSAALFLTMATGYAQTAKPKTTTPVTYTVSIGGLKDANISADQFKKIVDSAVTVKDQKGVSYPVVRFRINYTFATTYRDGETQQVKNYKDFRAADFHETNLLPEVWRSSIKDNAKKDDEVIINNVIIRLKNGKKMMVTEWKGKLR